MSEPTTTSETDVSVVVNTPAAPATPAPTHTTAKVETTRIESKELRVMRDLHAFAIEAAEKEVAYQNSIKKLESDLKKSAEAVVKPFEEKIAELEKAVAKATEELNNEKAKKSTKFVQGIVVAIVAWLIFRYIVGVS